MLDKINFSSPLHKGKGGDSITDRWTDGGDYNIPFAFLQKGGDNNIGITHVCSCINICWVTRKLSEHKADRPSFKTSPEGPSKC